MFPLQLEEVGDRTLMKEEETKQMCRKNIREKVRKQWNSRAPSLPLRSQVCLQIRAIPLEPGPLGAV